MKLYVDVLPKSCDDCPCFYDESISCQASDKWLPLDEEDNFSRSIQRHPSCPLQTLADHDKKVRAEVVAEIKQKAVHSHFGYMGKTEKGYYDIYAGILEDIEQGGEE